ncbi:hypothetical protein [Acidithiobacillus acidisediminis]|uniref:hypothetical protein n=1 Tax=Acidithiobacillus acidisediminis TaxID=2937799 RepID=UPI00200BE62D
MLYIEIRGNTAGVFTVEGILLADVRNGIRPVKLVKSIPLDVGEEVVYAAGLDSGNSM